MDRGGDSGLIAGPVLLCKVSADSSSLRSFELFSPRPSSSDEWPLQLTLGIPGSLWLYTSCCHPYPPWQEQGHEGAVGELQGEWVRRGTATARPQQSSPVPGTSPAAAFAQRCPCFLQGRGQLFVTKAVAGAGSSCRTQRTQVFLLPEPLPAGTDLKMNRLQDAVTRLKTRSFFYLTTMLLE